ncbi:MAG: iron donor protein CyaY [Paucibacter sp.]|nr:iron donor protein CyaY [Roseateles sp.]MBV8379917.1 iron donor protein CyaY [Roseateles sp.]
MSDAEYHHKTQAVLAAIEAQIDAWLDEGEIDIDTHRTGGLLELSFPNGSKIVINTQPPLHELWLAARSGGFHFAYADGVWRSTRDGAELFSKLSQVAGDQAGQVLRFDPPGA